jgi:hypothetical protein
MIIKGITKACISLFSSVLVYLINSYVSFAEYGKAFTIVGSTIYLLILQYTTTTLQAGRSPVRVLDEVDFLNLPNPSSHTMALGLTQPLTEMSTRNLPGGKKAAGLITLSPSVSWMSEDVGASTSRNPKGLHSLYRDNFTFCSIQCKELNGKEISNWLTMSII